jgi:NADH:ubiquinone oxidoreductase subunit 6 (subunit J)
MASVLYYVVGVIIALLAGVIGYVWRKRTVRWWRVFGGIMLVLLPVYLFMAITVASSITSRAHVLHSLPPQSDITHFEAALLLSLFLGPFWSFGALCGYMLRSLTERPLQL